MFPYKRFLSYGYDTVEVEFLHHLYDYDITSTLSNKFGNCYKRMGKDLNFAGQVLKMALKSFHLRNQDNPEQIIFLLNKLNIDRNNFFNINRFVLEDQFLSQVIELNNLKLVQVNKKIVNIKLFLSNLKILCILSDL